MFMMLLNLLKNIQLVVNQYLKKAGTDYTVDYNFHPKSSKRFGMNIKLVK